jgi:hypothetical protein
MYHWSSGTLKRFRRSTYSWLNFCLGVFSPDQVLPALYGENNMDLNLCLGVGDDMPLRWSFSQFVSRYLQRSYSYGACLGL